MRLIAIGAVVQFSAAQSSPIPPPQRSLEIPPIIDPAKTAILSGFVPVKIADEKGPPAPASFRSVVWMVKPSSMKTPQLSDQPVILGAAGFAPGTLVLTPGTRIDLRTTEIGVRTVRGEGLLRFDRRLTRKTGALPIVLDRAGAVTMTTTDSPPAQALVVAVDSPFLAVATADGAFSIVGLPPGRREIRIRLPSGKIVEKTVELREGKELTVDWREPPPAPPATLSSWSSCSSCPSCASCFPRGISSR